MKLHTVIFLYGSATLLCAKQIIAMEKASTIYTLTEKESSSIAFTDNQCGFTPISRLTDSPHQKDDKPTETLLSLPHSQRVIIQPIAKRPSKRAINNEYKDNLTLDSFKRLCLSEK